MSILTKKDIFGKVALVFTVFLFINVIYTSFFKSGNIKKIGVVEMDKLVFEFKGMKDATQDFTLNVKEWSAEQEGMETKLNHYLDEMKMDSLNNDTKKLKIDQQKFLILRKNYMEFDKTIKEKSQSKDQEMTVGVINQLKSYMKEFAEENGYDIILTNTQMQSIGYVKSVNDITQDVLAYSNAKYEGKN